MIKVVTWSMFFFCSGGLRIFFCDFNELLLTDMNLRILLLFRTFQRDCNSIVVNVYISLLVVRV